MKSNFNDCLTRLLKDEGGYSNNPNDNGGPTKYGITLTDYRKYINKDGVAADVKKMSVEQASLIYKERYWNALDCDNASSGVDYTIFDYAVNSGLGRPRKALQRFKSLRGTELIDAINDERTAFLQAIGVGHNAGFLAGWVARVSRVRAHSKALAGQKDNTIGPVVATTTIGLGATLSQYWHDYMWLILGGSVAAAIAVGLAIHFIKNKGK